MKSKKEAAVKLLLFVCASLAVAAVVAITALIVISAWQFLTRYGVVRFILGSEWSPVADEPAFGILPMIAGTGAVTLCALVLGGPIAIFTAIYLAELAKPRTVKILQPFIDLLAGIPSVVYGFWGIVVLVPFLRREPFAFRYGYSVLAGGVVLAIMILPTIIRISTDALRSVPNSYRDGSYALGANQWQTIFRVVLPAAQPGIFTAFVLGLGRAIGETMAVLMVTGNAKGFPTSLASPVRTLTGNIALELNYSWGMHRQALFGIGAVLVIIILLLNMILNRVIVRKSR